MVKDTPSALELVLRCCFGDGRGVLGLYKEASFGRY